jgi:D-xylose transport system substrate-binding protein
MKIKNLPNALHYSPACKLCGHAKEVKIGMAIDDLRLERWQKDRDIFVKKAESLVPSVCSVG